MYKQVYHVCHSFMSWASLHRNFVMSAYYQPDFNTWPVALHADDAMMCTAVKITATAYNISVVHGMYSTHTY